MALAPVGFWDESLAKVDDVREIKVVPLQKAIVHPVERRIQAGADVHDGRSGMICDESSYGPVTVTGGNAGNDSIIGSVKDCAILPKS